jgi:hypothetical protein
LHELMEKHVAGQGGESSSSVDMDVMVQTFGSLVQGLKAVISRLEADKQVEHSTVRHQDALQGHNNTYDTFTKRLEESAAARKRAEEGLKLIGAAQGTDVSASSQKSSPPDYETQIKLLKAQKQKNQTQMNESLIKHRDELQGHVRSKEDMRRRLEEAEDTQAKAEEKVRTHSWKPSCSVAVLRVS